MLSRPVELLLALFVGATPASVIMGDLKETAVRKGHMWFALACLNVLFSCSWKSIAGYLAASACGGYFSYLLSSHFHASTAVHAPGTFQLAWGSTLAILAGLLTLTALYSAIHFGPKDPLTISAAAFAVLGAAATAIWWRTVLVIAVIALAALLALFALRSREGRRGLLALAILVVFQVLFWPTGMTLMMICVKRMSFFGVFPVAILAGMYFVMVAVLCGGSAWLHRRMFETRLVTVQ